jgi:hypothetical protein
MKTKSNAIKYAQSIVGQLYSIGDNYAFNAGNRQSIPRDYWAARAARAQSLIDYAHQYLGTESPQYEGGLWLSYVIQSNPIQSNPMKYHIRKTRYCYGPSRVKSLVCNEFDSPVVFESRKDALEWVREYNNSTYYLSHNESGRPTFTLVSIK